MNQKYLSGLLLTGALTAAGIFCWNYFMPQYANQHAWFILAYYLLFTAAIHLWLTRNTEPKKFVMRFMGVTGIKLFLNLIVIVIYGLTHKSSAVSFALMFVFIYFIFTFFESAQLIKNIKQKKENNA